jgi:hypothetical protein
MPTTAPARLDARVNRPILFGAKMNGGAEPSSQG